MRIEKKLYDVFHCNIWLLLHSPQISSLLLIQMLDLMLMILVRSLLLITLLMRAKSILLLPCQALPVIRVSQQSMLLMFTTGAQIYLLVLIKEILDGTVIHKIFILMTLSITSPTMVFGTQEMFLMFRMLMSKF